MGVFSGAWMNCWVLGILLGRAQGSSSAGFVTQKEQKFAEEEAKKSIRKKRQKISQKSAKKLTKKVQKNPQNKAKN